MNTIEPLDHQERLRREREEILSEKNRYYCALNTGNPSPTRNDLAMYYVQSGAAERFAATHPLKNS